MGFERENGDAGVRNHVAILPSVVCANEVAKRIEARVENTRAFLHHQGCIQMGKDLDMTRRTLVGFGSNPNCSSVLVVSLGCEAVDPLQLADDIARTGKHVEVIGIQKENGTLQAIDKGVRIAREMAQEASMTSRKPFDLSNLTVGIKCGASDTTSGVASNPATGYAADMIIDDGGTVIIGETTEIIGAEHIMAKRAKNERVAKRLLQIVDRIEEEGIKTGVDIRGSQPTPGNIKGGLSTIEEKSIGAIAKAGSRTLNEVIEYAEKPSENGLIVMDSPGREVEVVSGFMAAGAQLVIFSTGLCAPFGLPVVPVMKITGNPRTAKTMKDDIDVDVSDIITAGMGISEAGKKLYHEVLNVASGKMTKAEVLGYRFVDIWRVGPTL
ncbi:MAG: UxaA family hydrolase [Methanomassiliicoccales archaeon]|nr:UxaA family hydrolase [Methanomassiliicoccales archaeon]NYT16243.1 UxaA family hydrolase [Methanomassiliicoccales archaeon]